VADEAQLKILIVEGVRAWNQWRQANPFIQPDFRKAKLSLAYLSEAPFGGANLSDADFSGAELSGADLRGANFAKANLMEADLTGANLSDADLRRLNLTSARLSVADLDGADLSGANLSGANLSRARLVGARLSRAELVKTDLTEADLDVAEFDNCVMKDTLMGNVDLRRCKGLETIKHSGPSTIGIDTIYRSGGNIPEVFLRGCGVPEDFITYMKSLVGKTIEFYSCFISYSRKDQEFAERLHADLRSKNVRCWFAPEDLKIGDKLRPAFDEAIRVHDKLMVLLSENSVGSPWVEKEVETAFEKERQQKRTVLFPIRLDEAVMETDQAWAADIRRTRHIGDFRDWKNHDSYKRAFDRLLRDLKAV
jgi:hypothetical protein